jgi:nitrate/nitrite-specific signal transduction histidine kinase
MIENRSLGQRVGLGYLLIGLLVLLASSLGLIFMELVTRTISATQSGLQQFDELNEMERSWANVAATVDRMLLTRQTSGAIQTDLEQALTAFNQQLAALGTNPALNEQDLRTVMTLQLLGEQLTEQVEQITAVARDGRWSRAQVIRHTEMSSLQRRFDENLAQLRANIRQTVSTSVADALNSQNSLRFVWIGAVIVAILIGTVASIRLVRSITKPVDELIAQTRRMTQRDFSQITPLSRQDELGQLSRAFAEMIDLLRESYSELEERVAARTRALLTSAEVSRRLTTILDPDDLIQAVVDQIDAAFGYYHTQIYLYDATRNYLLMVGGTGEAGRQLLAKNHKIEQGQGLVGRAAASGTPVLVSDVNQATDWLPNPLLPETKAETAVPIVIGQDVLGVLDVQHNVVGGLQPEDIELLQAIANQVAIALQNAKLYKEAEKRAQREARIRAINARILSTSDMATAMQVAARELGQTIGARQTMVRLLADGPSAEEAREGNGRYPQSDPTATDREIHP